MITCVCVCVHVYVIQDIYSWGMIMWEMLTGELPWYGCQNMVIMRKVVINKERPDLPGKTRLTLCALWHCVFPVSTWHQQGSIRLLLRFASCVSRRLPLWPTPARAQALRHMNDRVLHLG